MIIKFLAICVIVGTLMWAGNNALDGIFESAQARADHINSLIDDHMDAINAASTY